MNVEVTRLSQLLHEPLPDSTRDEHVEQLVVPGALQRGELLEMRHSPVFRSFGVLLDDRSEGSLDIHGNAVLLVVRRITSTSTLFPAIETARHKWTVADSSVDVHRRGVDVRLEVFPRIGHVAASGADISLYDLELAGWDTLADYGDPEDVVAANMPAWTSRARVRGMAQLIGPARE